MNSGELQRMDICLRDYGKLIYGAATGDHHAVQNSRADWITY
jgi:hypothetical protein